MPTDPSLTTNEPTENPGQSELIGALTVRVDALEDVTADARLDVLEGQTLDARLDALEAQTLDARLDVIEGQTLDSRLDTLEGQSLDTRLDTIEGQNLQSRIAIIEAQTLDARVDVLEGQTLDARLTILEDNTLDARLDVLEGQSLDTRLDTLEGQTLDARLDALEALTISARLTALESTYDSLGDSITAHAARLTALELSAGFDIRRYGALCDGSTDDADAWEDAIAAAHAAGGGVVIHPGGTSCISRGLVFPNDSYVGLKGTPGSIIQAKSGAEAYDPLTGPMLKQEMVTGYGARHGRWEDFIVDGNRIAEIGIHIQCVDRQFDNIQIQDCTSIGLYNAGSQNCQFNSIKCFGNGSTGTSPFQDANYVLDLGARLNTHVGMQLSAWSGEPEDEGVCNLLFTQSAVSSIAGGEPPSYNVFINCQFERVSPGAWEGCVIHRAGFMNQFFGCSFSGLGYPNIIINNDDDANSDGISGYLQVYGGGFHTDTHAIRAYPDGTGARPAVCLWGGITIIPTTTYFSVSDDSEIQVNATLFGGGTTLVQNYGGGTKTVGGLITSRVLSLPTTPNSTTGVPASHAFSAPFTYDAQIQALAAYQGSWRDANLS